MEELRIIVNKANVTYCDSDPLPISDVSRCENFCGILNIFTAIINCSLINNSFPDSEKLAVIKPIIKGYKDTQCLSSYRPVSNLTFLSKTIDSVLLTQLLDHFQQCRLYRTASQPTGNFTRLRLPMFSDKRFDYPNG